MSVTEGFPYPLYDATDPDLLQRGPLLIEGWSWWLRNHPDITYVAALTAILRKDAKIGYRGPPLAYRNQNHRSALDAPDILSSDLHKQLQHYRLTMIDADTEPQFVCSPLGLVPKHNGG